LILFDSIGQHLLHKLKNTPEFYNDLVTKLGINEANVLYNSIRNQAKLHALIQHGGYKSFDKKEIMTSLFLRIRQNNKESLLEIPGEAFQLKISYDSQGGFLDIEGFSDNILKKIGIDKANNGGYTSD
jgi:hypothetical protein